MGGGRVGGLLGWGGGSDAQFCLGRMLENKKDFRSIESIVDLNAD